MPIDAAISYLNTIEAQQINEDRKFCIEISNQISLNLQVVSCIIKNSVMAWNHLLIFDKDGKWQNNQKNIISRQYTGRTKVNDEKWRETIYMVQNESSEGKEEYKYEDQVLDELI